MTGNTPVTAAMLSAAWNAEHAGERSCHEPPVRVPRAHGDPDTGIEQNTKAPDNRQRAEQANLLADDGEDEVGVRLGQVEELLA